MTDPNGNSICYAYDSLGRVTKVNANGTTCRLFYYDNSTGFSGTIPPGISVSNSAGRMVEAATSNCSTTLLTDFWFSYDADGHVTDQWESTPNSGQYYHSVATFFGNDVVNTLQLASPSLYTMTYGIDGEGRWSSVKGSGTQSYVTSTTYNAASEPTEIALTGSSPDQDDYVYDSNTGRMKTFTLQVGNTPSTMVGQLTWNPNGTLNNLAITDGFNAGGTQTCYFNPSSGSGMGYDDLGRLLNYDCGSGGWGQTFSYDQYDNLTKSVISGRSGITWNPGYNNSNNQLSLGGTTYDSDGDLTYDLVHHYAWNEFAKMKSVDGSGTNCATGGECIVYDALGRAVEIDTGSTYTEIWYTQLGKTAYMTGSTINRANWPAPGGGTEQINGGGSYYMHKDWLGNARIVSTTNSHTVKADMAFAPYGEIYDQFGVTSTQYQMFTGDTQDIVSGMMDTPNREFNNAAQGRWLSPDPTGGGWNQYAYTTNPLSLIDPRGLSPYPWQCHVCWDDIGNQGGGENPNLGLFGAYMAYSQSGSFGLLGSYDNVGSDGSTVVADSEPDVDLGFDPNALDSNPGNSITGNSIIGGPADGSDPADIPVDLFGMPLLPGEPASMQIVGLLGQYSGPWGNGSFVVANMWQEQVVDILGNPVVGVDQVYEEVHEMQWIGLDNPTTAGEPWQGGSPVDYIGFGDPRGFSYNQVQQTFSVSYMGAMMNLSTVIMQTSVYQNGTLVSGSPTIITP